MSLGGHPVSATAAHAALARAREAFMQELDATMLAECACPGMPKGTSGPNAA